MSDTDFRRGGGGSPILDQVYFFLCTFSVPGGATKIFLNTPYEGKSEEVGEYLAGSWREATPNFMVVWINIGEHNTIMFLFIDMKYVSNESIFIFTSTSHFTG